MKRLCFSSISYPMTVPLLTIHNGYLSYGAKPIFQGIDVTILENSHICLIGNNGQGKSTLLKVFSGLIELDKGTFYKKPHSKIHYLPQDLDLPNDRTALEIVSDSGCQEHEACILLDTFEIKPSLKMANLSGGEKRRVLLASTLSGDPDALLLDEPTNHLDIKCIQWLESYMNSFKKAVVMISHDRRFLKETSRSLIWLQHGHTRSISQSYAYFEEHTLEEYERSTARTLEKMNSKLRLEEHWLQRGVTARRKRNQGRLQKLQEMRHQRKMLSTNQTKSLVLGSKESSFGNQLVAELIDVQKSYEGRLSLGPFSTRIFKGDRIGIIGPNGAGKTTLLKLIIGELKPDAGRIRTGKALEPAFFEQERTSMNPTETPWQYLCPRGGDSVMVQDEPMHVVGYLKKFLFDDKQARSPIGVLSGGEKNRLQLAKVLAQPSNVLVLDEPTNDLDMDTLDVLIDMLSSYKGTLVLISHDRDFIDQLTTVVYAIQPNGNIIECIGGYSDYEKMNQESLIRQKPQKSLLKEEKQERPPHVPTYSAKKISYTIKRDLELLPGQIKGIEERLREIELLLLDPDLYMKDLSSFDTLTKELQTLKEQREGLENRWLELSLTYESYS